MKLKTLNDMNLFFGDRLKLEKEFFDWAKKKGIQVCPLSVIGWIQNEIRARDRQEIIRHLRELRNHSFYCLVCEKFDCDCGSSDCFKPRSKDVENWLKHFLNITEEDLK